MYLIWYFLPVGLSFRDFFRLSVDKGFQSGKMAPPKQQPTKGNNMINGQSFTRNKQYKDDDGSLSHLIKQGGLKGNLPVVVAVLVLLTLTFI